MTQKQNIKDIPIVEMPKLIEGLGLKKFTATQIVQWLYKKNVTSIEEMTNISKENRTLLTQHFYVGNLELVNTLESSDGTKKFAWKLHDGKIIESVLIPSESHEKATKHGQSKVPRDRWQKRLTLCISTQVGCAMGCEFCRTGEMGFIRNLSQGEIVDQILAVSKQEAGSRKQDSEKSCLMPHASCLNQRISNVVLMGMGEPLANYDNVMSALHIMIETKCLNLSRRHVTVSTSGLLPEIERFAKDNPGAKLAISLNGTTDEERTKLMPINKKYPIAKLFETLKKYSRDTKRNVITFEYVMVGDFNDSAEDAKRLVKLLSQFPSKVNLIPLNPFKGCEYKAPDEASVQRFAQALRNKHVQVNIRSSRGQDILAACGQLASGE